VVFRFLDFIGFLKSEVFGFSMSCFVKATQ
jgi:hypothetical protein